MARIPSICGELGITRYRSDLRSQPKTRRRLAGHCMVQYSWRNVNIVAWVAVAGSIAATVLAAVQLTPSWLTATIAAIPAAVLAINTTFNFERKALWHWLTTKRFEGLIRRLKYEKAEEAEVSKEFSRIDIETFEGWMDYSALSRQKEPETVNNQNAGEKQG